MINTTNIIDKYAKHNKDIFIVKNYNNDNSKILIEFHGWSSAHICFSYLIDALNKKFKSKLIAYEGYTLISTNKTNNISKIKILFYPKILLVNFLNFINHLESQNL